jgi:signal transduction histidine kinase
VLAPLVLGRALRSTKHGAEFTVRQAALEHEKATSEAIADERARIARELHDIVSHSISAMGIQAGAVRRLLPRGSELEAALRSVEDTGRDALDEMHRLLMIVRYADGEHAAAFGPQPCLERLSELIDQARGAGLTVDLNVEGDRTLPLGLDLAAYRIVQEALTNVRRHAAGARARVDVYRRERELEIVVADDGSALSGPVQAGHGWQDRTLCMTELQAFRLQHWSSQEFVEAGFTDTLVTADCQDARIPGPANGVRTFHATAPRAG